ncbi:leucine-rich repeat-containing protein 34 isoform X1 [Oryzias melastigma]|uniref:leucine-rich repeat-containing protein 34 isoform X1 n=1 Tax=Oryzias melastigma TaxID=30732 RepID=UPI000CF7C2AA|nr:leucine-rich repeat-containing protein 34 isoform X1 [Oryzias melastigma]
MAAAADNSETLAKFYQEFCLQLQINVNKDVLDVLNQKIKPGFCVSRTFTLQLPGNRGRRAQRLEDKDVFVLSKCLQNREGVTGLDVSYNNISDGGVKHLADLLLLRSSALKSLDLKFNNIQADGVEILANSLKSNSSLLSLSLSGNQFGDRGGVHVSSMLQVNSTLQLLQVSDCNLADRSVAALGVALKHNTALQALDISRPLLFSQQEEWAMHFSQMLTVNRSLLELHLGRTGLTDTGMEMLAEGLRQNHSLRCLDLRCNHVTRDGAHHLAEVLRQNPTLEVIDLSSNRIEDEGAAHLSEAIATPGCSLKELSVSRNCIRTEGLLSLAQALKHSPTLTHLYIWGNHLDEPVCQVFSELLSSGRLLPQRTDVSPYQVDGQLFLAEVFQGLRTQICSIEETAACSSAALLSEVRGSTSK